MKLSQVKTKADFERYEAGKIAQTHEQLQREMGIGSEAYMCEHWDDSEWDDESGGDFCDYLSWRYGLKFGGR